MHIVLRLTDWLPDTVICLRLRGSLASPFLKSCGKRLGLGRNITFYNPSQVSLGSDVYIAYGCWFSASNGITLDNEVIIGPYTVFATSNHSMMNGSFRFGPSIGSSIFIGKGTWVSAHCTVSSGVQIGSGSIVGANSFVNKSFGDHVLVAGTPVKYVKNLQSDYPSD